MVRGVIVVVTTVVVGFLQYTMVSGAAKRVVLKGASIRRGRCGVWRRIDHVVPADARHDWRGEARRGWPRVREGMTVFEGILSCAKWFGMGRFYSAAGAHLR